MRWLACVAAAAMAQALYAQATYTGKPFEIVRKRVDVDVDGAPTAYGPAGFKTLDTLSHAHAGNHFWEPVVGYITDHGRPVVQGPYDPAPGFYVSQTTFEDPSLPEHDPRRYVDATRINYVVLGNAARDRGVKIGDFVAVHSRHTGRSVYGVVADSGNASGDEGSLHLLQALGYPFHDGRRESVEDADVVVRYFPGSNPKQTFFRKQSALDAAAKAMGLSRTF